MAVLAGIKDSEKLKSYQVTHFQPFDPVHKRTEATIKVQGQAEFKVTKGAPQSSLHWLPTQPVSNPSLIKRLMILPHVVFAL